MNHLEELGALRALSLAAELFAVSPEVSFTKGQVIACLISLKHRVCSKESIAAFELAMSDAPIAQLENPS